MKMKNLIHKWLKPALLTSILLPFSAIATTSTHLISITPASDFPTEVAVSTTTPLKFTVTNLASTAPLTIVDQSQFLAGSGLSLSSPCNKALYLGQSCTIQVQLQAPATPTVVSGFLKEKAQPSLDAVQLPFSVTVKKEVASTTLAVAVGGEGTSSINPLFIASKDGGKTWVKSNFSNASNTYLRQVNCVGSGDKANCVALTSPAYITAKSKQISDMKVVRTTPPVIFSNDSGQTWAASTGLPNTVSINNLSCAGQTANQSVCSLVGYDYSIKNSVLFTSYDQGKTWSAPKIADLPKSSSLYHTSCATNAGKVTCIAVGDSARKASLVFTSDEGAQTWTQAAIKIAPGIFTNSSCAGKVCTAIGNFSSGYPPLWVSTDSGKNWNFVKTSNITLYTTSCGGNDNQVTCIAAGQDDNSRPVLLVSTDTGNSWIQQSLHTKRYGNLYASGCSNSINPVCTVAGTSFSSSELQKSQFDKSWQSVKAIKDADDLPLLYVSNNGGKNWQSVTTELTSDIELSSTNCTGSGNDSAVCLAAGTKAGGRLPFLLASSDSSKSWSSITQGLTTPGQLLDTGGNQINFGTESN